VGARGTDVVVAVFRVFYQARLVMVEFSGFEALAEYFDERTFGGSKNA
jgi:hypothetical protein